MFKLFTRAAWLGCCIGVVMSGADARAEATLSLKAVKKNGAAIAPTNDLPGIVPGDTITVELRYSGWGHPNFDAAGANTGLVRVYQAIIAGLEGVQSSGLGHGLVLPVGWDAPLTRDVAPCENPCYTVPNQQYGCVGNNFRPVEMGSIDNARPDFILTGFSDITRAFANDSLNIKWGGNIFDTAGQPDGQCFGGSNAGVPCAAAAECRVCVGGSLSGVPCTSAAQCTGGGTCPAGGTCQPGIFYGGTLNLMAMPADACTGRPPMCGDFTFNFDPRISSTFLSNPLTPPNKVVPVLQSLVIHGPQCAADIGACCNGNAGVCNENVMQPPNCEGAGMRFGGHGSTCEMFNPPCAGPNRIVSSDPPHCAIDARIPFVQGFPTQRRGFQSIALTFERTAGTTEDSATDYTVQTFGSGQGIPATISGVPVLNGNVVTINFLAPIPSKKWTCVMHNASNTRRCIGGLPADANGDGTAAPVDILDIIDNLNGVTNPPLAIYQSDIDRSAESNPADILTEIDLLNGASGYPVANGTTIDVVCPSTTGP